MRWFCIAENSQALEQFLLEGKPKAVRAAGMQLCLIRKGQEVFALKDECPHSGALFSQGHTNAFNDIVCPLHGYVFSLKTGVEADHKCKQATTFPVRQREDGSFYVGI